MPTKSFIMTTHRSHQHAAPFLCTMEHAVAEEAARFMRERREVRSRFSFSSFWNKYQKPPKIYGEVQNGKYPPTRIIPLQISA